MSATCRQVDRWTLVAVTVLSGAPSQTVTTAGSALIQQETVAFTIEAANFAEGGWVGRSEVTGEPTGLTAGDFSRSGQCESV